MAKTTHLQRRLYSSKSESQTALCKYLKMIEIELFRTQNKYFEIMDKPEHIRNEYLMKLLQNDSDFKLV